MKQEQIEIAFNQLGKLMIHFGESKAWTGFDLGVTEEEYSQFNELILKQKHYWMQKSSPNGRKSMILLKNQKPLQ